MKSISTHQSLQRGLLIVEAVADMDTPTTLSAIARRTNLNPSTTHHILKALVEFGYLIHSRDNRTYSLSSKLFQIIGRTWTIDQLADIAQPYLKELGDLTGEGTSLAVFQDDRVIIAAKREPDGPLRVAQKIGDARPIHCTAVGKVLVAWLPEPKREALIERIAFQRKTTKTITSPAMFRQELARVRETGIGFDNEEHIKGVRCMAVPVKDYSGEVRLALCIVGPKVNLPDRRVNKLKHDLIAMAGRLSTRLGCKPSPEQTALE